MYYQILVETVDGLGKSKREKKFMKLTKPIKMKL